MSSSSLPLTISEIRDQSRQSRQDQVAVEEPLEIRLGYKTPDGRTESSISITMRTPGDDEELAAISAPSSLAADLPREFNVTLVGFLRGDTFNIYAAEERIR